MRLFKLLGFTILLVLAGAGAWLPPPLLLLLLLLAVVVPFASTNAAVAMLFDGPVLRGTGGFG